MDLKINHLESFLNRKWTSAFYTKEEVFLARSVEKNKLATSHSWLQLHPLTITLRFPTVNDIIAQLRVFYYGAGGSRKVSLVLISPSNHQFAKMASILQNFFSHFTN